MSSRCNHLAGCLGVLLAALVCAGCTSIEIGDAGYTNGTISLPVINTGSPSEGYIQVTVYEIRNNQQEETDVFYAPLVLQQGRNTAFIPGRLEPGQYKLYFYLIQNGERRAAAIRDIAVN